MALSDTVPSDFNVASFCPPTSVSAPSSIGTGSSAGGLRAEGIFEVPPAPEVAVIEKEKLCPYCCLIYPAKTFSANRRSRRWRKHLLDDLQPYICLFENCDQADKTYRTFKTWQAHLNKSHVQRWICPFAHEGQDVSNIEDSTFDTIEGFQEHIALSHIESDSAELHSLTRGASQQAVLPSWCFVCLSEQTSDITLQQHMAEHLETAFILSLPARDDIKDSSGLSSGRPSGGYVRSDGEPLREVDVSDIRNLFPDDTDPDQIRAGPSLTATEFNTQLAAYSTRRDPAYDMDRFFDHWTEQQPKDLPGPRMASWLKTSDRRWKLILNVSSFIGYLRNVTEFKKAYISRSTWHWRYAYAYAVLESRRRRGPTKPKLGATLGNYPNHRLGAVNFAVYRLRQLSRKKRTKEHLTCFLAYAVLESWRLQAARSSSIRGSSSQLQQEMKPLNLEDTPGLLYFCGFRFVSLLFRVRSARVGSIEEFLPRYIRRQRTLRRWKLAIEFVLYKVRYTHSLPMSIEATEDVHARMERMLLRWQAKKHIQTRRRWKTVITAVICLIRLGGPTERSDLELSIVAESLFSNETHPALSEPPDSPFAVRSLSPFSDRSTASRTAFEFLNDEEKAMHRWRVLRIAILFAVHLRYSRPRARAIHRDGLVSQRRESSPSILTAKRYPDSVYGWYDKARDATKAKRSADSTLDQPAQTEEALFRFVKSDYDSPLHRWKVLCIVVTVIIRLRRAVKRPRRKSLSLQIQKELEHLRYLAMHRWRVLFIFLRCMIHLRRAVEIPQRTTRRAKPPYPGARRRSDGIFLPPGDGY